jgi:Na+/H+ antiporter NhaD/arsenite permease-like protein
LAILGVMIAFLSGAHLGFSTLVGAMFVIIVTRAETRDSFGRVDWTLLVFFCALFVVVHGFASTGLVEDAWTAILPLVHLDRIGGVIVLATGVVVGSNIVSNVPLVMLVGEYVGSLSTDGLGWYLLAWISTVAGNLTLLGSVANIIVAERAREHYDLGFGEYLRFGAVSTVVVVALGTALLLLLQ